MTKADVTKAVLELAAYQREIDATVDSPLRYARMEKYVAMQEAMFRSFGWVLNVRTGDIAGCSDGLITQLVSEAFKRATRAGIIGEPLARARLSLTVGKPLQDRKPKGAS